MLDVFKRNKLKTAVYGALIVIYIVAVLFAVSLVKTSSNARLQEFTEGWYVLFDGKEYTNVNLNDFKMPRPVEEGEFITMKNKLPRIMENGSAIVLPLHLTTVSVEVDGSIVYGYGSRNLAENIIVGSAVHIIRIPDGSQGGDVSIVLRPGERKAFSYLPRVMLDKTTWGFIDYLNYNLYPVVISISLIMGGMIMIVISAITAFAGQRWEKISQTGMMFFTIGCWNLCEVNAVQLFSLDFEWNTFTRYLFGFLSILPALRIISSSDVEGKEREKNLQRLIYYGNELCILVLIILSAYQKVHICCARYFFQTLAFVSIVTTSVLELMKYKKKEAIYRTRTLEVAIFFVCIIAEIIRYYLHSQFNLKNPVLQHSFLLYGTVLLVLMMLGSYIYELYISYLKQAERKALKEIAYTDGLTGLLNRTYCKERMEELDNDTRNYFMISFDVDGLKRINDSKGHPEGDKLLVTFADILSRCFSDVGDVIRPGGDEFLVISDDAKKSELQSRLNWLDDLEKSASKALGFKVKAAYGIAGSNEVAECTTEKVYNLADQRMYDMKTKKKT